MAARGNAAILLVEDDDFIRGVTAMLRALGYTNLTVAANGAEAVNACTHAHFDVIVMDCEMPVMDGWEATRQIRALGVRTPVLAYTASVRPTSKSRCTDAGMDDFLVKPAQPAQLALRLQHWLTAAQARRG